LDLSVIFFLEGCELRLQLFDDLILAIVTFMQPIEIISRGLLGRFNGLHMVGGVTSIWCFSESIVSFLSSSILFLIVSVVASSSSSASNCMMTLCFSFI
jgi:hypothetical protein